jgi:hypothetical protein
MRATPIAIPAIGASPPPSPIPCKNHAKHEIASDIPKRNVSNRRLVSIKPSKRSSALIPEENYFWFLALKSSFG